MMIIKLVIKELILNIVNAYTPQAVLVRRIRIQAVTGGFGRGSENWEGIPHNQKAIHRRRF